MQVLDPWTPLLIDLYHYLEQNGSVGLVLEHAPAGPSTQVLPAGPSSQVPPGYQVRHHLGSKEEFRAVCLPEICTLRQETLHSYLNVHVYSRCARRLGCGLGTGQW